MGDYQLVFRKLKDRVYADSCGLKTAFLGNGGRNAATIFEDILNLVEIGE